MLIRRCGKRVSLSPCATGIAALESLALDGEGSLFAVSTAVCRHNSNLIRDRRHLERAAGRGCAQQLARRYIERLNGS